MTIIRKLASVLAALTVTYASAALAEYPEKPIRMIYPYTAGGSGDALARLFAEQLTNALGVQVVVENRPGAGGNTGAIAAAQATPDGYTLFSVSPALAVNKSLNVNPGYDPIKDFEVVTPLSVVPNVLLVNADLPVKTLPELVALAKANPGKLNFGSSGIGTSVHLAGEMLKRDAKIDIVHIPYRGSAQAGTDLLGGQLQMMFDSAPTALANVRTGKARAIAIASKERLAELPDVPTTAEAGYPGVLSEAWTGILAPAKTPKPVITRISQEAAKITRDPAVIARLKQIGGRPFTGSSDEFAAFIKNEVERYAAIIKEAGIKPE